MKNTVTYLSLADPKLLLVLAILLLPVLTFLTLFILGKRMSRRGDWFAVANMSVVFFLSSVLTFQVWTGTAESYRFVLNWFSLPVSFSGLHTDRLLDFTISLSVDRFTALMLTTVSLVSLMVHLYSVDYMKVRRNYIRYFPYLGLFTMAMNGIVLSDNLLLTFVFWELVGFASYLLIGFWFDKDSAARASKKAFLVNRIGDAGFIVGVFALFVVFGSTDLSVISASINADNRVVDYNHGLLLVAAIGILLGCLGKSAQFPFQLWLPDAMEGPTPVSALLHAATMVAAGAYLLAKVSFFFPSEVLMLTAAIGAITALMGALPALVQHDIKKVLAYSTISQLGYMVMAIGCGAIEEARFHLITHAFFKSCLFLTAGAVIHTMHHLKNDLFVRGYYEDFDTLDMRLMGGLRKVTPITFAAYFISCAAIVGIPLFSGFLSKEAILTGVWSWSLAQSASGGSVFLFLIPASAFLTVLLTALYMSRQLLLVFFGEFRLGRIWSKAGDLLIKQHEHNLILLVPMIVLAIMSLFMVFSINPFSYHDSWLMKGLGVADSDHGGAVVMVLSLSLVLVGIVTSYLLYRKERELLPAGLFSQVLIRHYYLDEVYKQVLLYPGLWIARACRVIDARVIDGLLHLKAYVLVALAHILAFLDRFLIDGLVNLSANSLSWFGAVLISSHRGRVQSYMTFAVVSFVLILGILLYCIN